jgi:hypothetical protein
MHWLFKVEHFGGHAHVGVWCGTPAQAENQTRAKLGFLIMDPDEWTELRSLIETGRATEQAGDTRFDIEVRPA